MFATDTLRREYTNRRLELRFDAHFACFSAHFRPGGDDLISDGNHVSRISMEDYAIALVDELENPQHIRERFTMPIQPVRLKITSRGRSSG